MANTITYNGATYLIKEWATPTQLAKEHGRDPSYYRNIIFNQERGKGQRHVEFIRIPELDLTLVKR